VRFTEDCSVYPKFNPKSFSNESLRHGSISSDRIYGKGSIRFKCRWNTDNTIMNYDKEWSNEASLEDVRIQASFRIKDQMAKISML